MTESELNDILDMVEQSLYDAKVSLWVFDSAEARLQLSKANEQLTRLQENIEDVRRNFPAFGRKVEGEETNDEGRRARTRRLVKSGRLNTDYIFASSLRGLFDRMNSFLSEIEELKEGRIEARRGKNGFVYVILHAGDERFELRARSARKLNLNKIEAFTKYLLISLRKLRIKRASVHTLTAKSGNARLGITKIRVSTEGSIADVSLMDDDTLTADIMVDTIRRATITAEAILDAADVLAIEA